MFEEYITGTTNIYVELYGWHPISPTLHNILVCQDTIILHAKVPNGKLSEKGADRYKHFRLYKQQFSIKYSQESCNNDVLKRLLLS